MKFECPKLPSRGIPYAVKEINVAPFRPVHMSFISEAIYARNNAPLIEAVGQVMDFDVKQLTDGDFYYILAWLRFNSRDLPIYSDWECGGVYFTRADDDKEYTIADIDQMVEQWELAEGTEAQAEMEDPRTINFIENDCHHHNKVEVKFEDFSIKYMSEAPLDPRLDYPRVVHMVEYVGLREENRYKKLIGPVRYIKEGQTLHAKLTATLEADSMELFDMAARANFEYEHGILQRVYKSCERCGIDHAFDVAIDAHSFFME